MISLTFLRHGRSEANEAELWQGQGDAALSATGQEQVVAAGRRLAGRSFDLVVSSDLQRAHDTAVGTGHPVEVDSRLREMDLGEWEGRTFEEVAETHPDLLAAIRNGEAVRFGSVGESILEFEERVWGTIHDLCERVGEGSVLVATHGGFIDAVVGRIIGRAERRTFPIVTNTSLTEVRYEMIGGSEPRFRLQTFNDATHLGWDHGFIGRMREEGRPVVGFLRHGVTAANKARKIQGQSCWGLDDDGHAQASAFAAAYGPVDRIWSSPIRRAAETAAALAPPEPGYDDALMEMSFGTWEGSLYDELIAADDAATRVFRHGEDLPRGGAERFSDVADRMTEFLGRAVPDPTERVVAVSHGAAIKSLVAAMHGRGNDINRDLAVSHNTGISHVVLMDEGPWLADWSVAPHLEGAGHPGG